MRTLVVCVVLAGCQSAEEKAARRSEQARVDASLRRTRFPLVHTSGRLAPDRAELVLRVTPAGLELEDQAPTPDAGHLGPLTLDRFKELRSEGWVQLPLLEQTLRERPSYQRLALDVAPQTPSFRVAQVVAFLGRSEVSVTFAGPAGLVALPLDTRGEGSETCAHDGVAQSETSCLVPRVRFTSAGVQVATLAGDERCVSWDPGPEEHAWNPAPLLGPDGGCFTDAPATLVGEAIALAPGCLHVAVEFGEPSLTWAQLGATLAAVAAEAPGRRFVVVGSLEVEPLDCAKASRPAQWRRFVRLPPSNRVEWSPEIEAMFSAPKNVDPTALERALGHLGADGG
jgi:hypothetical protein